MEAALKRRLERMVRWWMDTLGLADWRAEFAYDEQARSYACVESFWQYELARFHFDLKTVADKYAANGHDWLDELCCHEVVHCLLAPLADAADAMAKPLGKPMVKVVNLLHEHVTNTVTKLVRRLAPTREGYE